MRDPQSLIDRIDQLNRDAAEQHAKATSELALSEAHREKAQACLLEVERLLNEVARIEIQLAEIHQGVLHA